MNDHNGLTDGNVGSTYGPVWSPMCQSPTSLDGRARLETLDRRLWRFTADARIFKEKIYLQTLARLQNTAQLDQWVGQMGQKGRQEDQ